MCVYNKKDHNGTEALVSHDVLCYTLYTYTYTFKWHKFWEHTRQLLLSPWPSCFFMSAMSVLRPPQLNTHWNLTTLPVIDRDSLIGSLMHLVLLWRGCCRGRILRPLSSFTGMDPCAFIGFAMKSRLNI